MKRALGAAILSVVTLTGCGSVLLPYKPAPMARDTSVRVIEQTIMEQHPQFRPEGVYVGDEYIEIGSGVQSDSRSRGVGAVVAGVAIVGSRERGTAKQLVTRLYYNSIGDLRMYRKNRYYIVDIVAKDRHPMQRVYVRTEFRAQEFVDAIGSLRTP